MRDFRINPNETEREREIRVCQSPAFGVEQIILSIAVNGNVMATHRGGEESRMVTLFGSSTIPTPYTFAGVRDVEHFGAEILRNIQKLNPTCHVSWTPEKAADYSAFVFAQMARKETNKRRGEKR
jgi:hypothetical protein